MSLPLFLHDSASTVHAVVDGMDLVHGVVSCAAASLSFSDGGTVCAVLHRTHCRSSVAELAACVGFPVRTAQAWLVASGGWCCWRLSAACLPCLGAHTRDTGGGQQSGMWWCCCAAGCTCRGLRQPKSLRSWLRWDERGFPCRQRWSTTAMLCSCPSSPLCRSCRCVSTTLPTHCKAPGAGLYSC